MSGIVLSKMREKWKEEKLKILIYQARGAFGRLSYGSDLTDSCSIRGVSWRVSDIRAHEGGLTNLTGDVPTPNTDSHDAKYNGNGSQFLSWWRRASMQRHQIGTCGFFVEGKRLRGKETNHPRFYATGSQTVYD